MALLALPTTLPNGYIPTITEWNSTYFGAINTRVNDVTYDQVSTSLSKDEDNMASDSATHFPTQQSTKAYVDNTVNNLQIAVDDYRIIAGYDDTWGTPAFVVSGTANDVNVLASAADMLQLYINSTRVNITADTNVSSFALASAGVSATVSAGFYNAASAMGKTEAEFGDTEIIIDAYSSAWTATSRIDTIQAFKTSTEIFIGKVSKKSSAAELSISRAMRGIGNSSRVALADNDVVYLLELSTLFVGSDKTFYAGLGFPRYSATAPASAVAGNWYKNTSDGLWYRYTTSWVQTDAIPLALVACDSSTVVAVEIFDFDKAWSDTNESSVFPIIEGTSAVSAVSGCSSIGCEIFELNVAGTKVISPNTQELVLSANILSSESVASATLYYLYVTTKGEFYFSSTCPRNKSIYTGKRKGYYHPKYYWRSIGVLFTDPSKQVVQFYQKDNIYHYIQNGTAGGDVAAATGAGMLTGILTLTNAYVVYQLPSIPPGSIRFGSIDTFTGAANSIYQRKRINSFGIPGEFGNSVPSNYGSYNLKTIENSTVVLKISAGTTYLSPTVFELKF